MKKTLSVLLVLTLLLLPVMAMAGSVTTALVKGGALNLREKPSTDAKILTQYPNNTLVEILSSVNDTWAKVSVEGKTGYMMKKFLNTAKGSTTMYVNTFTGKGLNLRTSPSMDGKICASYKKGTEVKVLQHGVNWSRVKVGNREGFMASAYLIRANSTSPSTLPANFTELKTPYAAKLINPNGTGIVNFRDGASLNAKIIRTLKVGTEVQVLATSTDWNYVKIGSEYGFISSHFMTKAK